MGDGLSGFYGCAPYFLSLLLEGRILNLTDIAVIATLLYSSNEKMSCLRGDGWRIQSFDRSETR